MSVEDDQARMTAGLDALLDAIPTTHQEGSGGPLTAAPDSPAWLGAMVDLANGIDAEHREKIEGVRSAFSDAEWAELRDRGASFDTLMGLASQDVHARRKTIAGLQLGDRVGELMHAGLMASGQRRTKVEMCRFCLELYDIVREQRPMTVRQVFYQAVTRGLEKTKPGYDAVQRALTDMRRGDKFPEVPYIWIADHTRWMRKPSTHESLDAALQETTRTYRRQLWAEQPDYVEIWLEKDALAGVLYPITREWDVPLMVSRGYSSISFLYEAAETIKDVGRPTHIYVFTDRDRSGDKIAASIERTLHELAPGAEIHCHRAAVTADQVTDLDLPTRPPKRKGDPPAVELDAIPPDEFRRIGRDCIERHIDHDVLERTREIEEQERETLAGIVERFGGAA